MKRSRKYLNGPLTNADLLELAGDDLYEYLEGSGECTLMRCIHDEDSLYEVARSTCGGPVYGTCGVLLRAVFKPKKWWEVWYHQVRNSVDEEPLSGQRRNELAEMDRDPHYRLISKEREHKVLLFFKGMDPDRLSLESLPDSAEVEVYISPLGIVKARAEEVRTFLRGWERSDCVEKRKRMEFEEATPWLGLEPKFDYWKSDRVYVLSVRSVPAAGTIDSKQGNMSYVSPGRGATLGRSFEEKLGQRVVHNMVEGNVDFFSRLLQAAKGRAERANSRDCRSEDVRVLKVLCDLVSQNGSLPTKKELRLALEREGRFCQSLNDSSWREIGLMGLPGEFFYRKGKL